jgi:hypothetical protein
LNSIDCTTGVPPRNRYDSVVPSARVAEITIIERDGMVKQIEKEIDEIQDFLDEWNFKTTI